jgi:hypothetical protein
MIQFKYGTTFKTLLQPGFSTSSIVDFEISSVSNLELNLYANKTFQSLLFHLSGIVFGYIADKKMFFYNVPSLGLLL